MEHKAWPYMAGIIDSDGTIAIPKRHDPDLTKAQTRVAIVVANTDVRLMHWIVRNFGGQFVKRPNRKGFSASGGCGFIYHWNLSPTKFEWFIRNIQPYLVLKNIQAKLVLEYLSLGRGWNVDKRIRLSDACTTANHYFPSGLPRLNDLNDKDISAYAAGFIDGDGSLYVQRANSQIRIGVTSKAFRTIRWFMKHFGGRFTVLQKTDRKIYYVWGLSGRKNKEMLLLRLSPYFQLKREQANILLNMLKIIGKHRVQDVRRSLSLQCSVLNNR